MLSESHKQGHSAEFKLAALVIEHGINVAFPVIPGPIDIVLITEFAAIRVQVKSTTSKAFHLRNGDRQYKKDAFDLLVLYSEKDNEFYVLKPGIYRSNISVSIAKRNPLIINRLKEFRTIY